jgi:hypothetical protein
MSMSSPFFLYDRIAEPSLIPEDPPDPGGTEIAHVYGSVDGFPLPMDYRKGRAMRRASAPSKGGQTIG